jgi:hypothetical protein
MTYELRTVVEYQTAEDLMALEITRYLTVNPEGKVRLGKGEEKASVKEKGKGYDKTRLHRPDFKGGSGSHRRNVGKGHGKDKGKPDKPPGKPEDPPRRPDEPGEPGKGKAGIDGVELASSSEAG